MFGHRFFPRTGCSSWHLWSIKRRSIPSHIQFHQQCKHISTRTALHLLGLTREQETGLTIQQLRQAYFAAAKRCHPDTQTAKEENRQLSRDSKNGHDDFLQLTAAYEHLSRSIRRVDGGDGWEHEEGPFISTDEEADFRAACEMQLGVPAEIVEECKRSPIFRRWLAGRTDSAHTWRNFFAQNGGLAPKLQTVTGHLPSGTNVPKSRLQSRRKKR